MERKSILEMGGICPKVGCCNVTYKLGESIENVNDAKAGYIHPIPRLNEPVFDGVLTKTFVARCPKCGELSLIDERYAICGYELRNCYDEQSGMFNETDYYTCEEYLATYDVTVGDDMAIYRLSASEVADPVTDIDEFIEYLFKEHPNVNGKEFIIEHGEDPVILARPIGDGYEIFIQKTRI